MKYKAVKICWLDSRGMTARWEFSDELEKLPPCEIVSVGFIVKETKKYITIACSVSEDQILGRLTIPKGCIVKTEEI